MARCIDCGFLTRRAIGAGSLSVDDVTIPPAGRAEIRDRRAHQVEFLACFLGLANFHDGCPDVAGTRDASGGYTPNLAFEQCAMTNVTRRRRCGAFRRFRPATGHPSTGAAGMRRGRPPVGC